MNASTDRTGPTDEQRAKLSSTRRLTATDTADVPALIQSHTDGIHDRVWLLNGGAEVIPGVLEFVQASTYGHRSIVHRELLTRTVAVGEPHGLGGHQVCRHNLTAWLTDRPCCGRVTTVNL